MNVKKILLCLAISLATSPVCSVQQISQNCFVTRPFSMNMAQEIMAEQSAWLYMNDNNSKRWFGTIQATAQYNQAFGTESETGLGSLPFWNGSNSMTVGRNSYGITTAYDVDSYQFGLGDTINSGLITLSPQVYSAGLNFFLFAAPHETSPGFFGKINIPCGCISINPNLNEVNQIIGQKYAVGEMNTAASNSQGALGFPIYNNMTQAFAGGNQQAAVINGTGTATPNNSVFQGLQFGTITGNQTSAFKFGDIDICYGYNFLANNHSHVGIGLRLSAPLGNKPQSIYMLEPIWGNGGHWGVGAEIIAHTVIWQGNNENNIQFWFDAQAMHLFKAMQIRSFDLIANGVGSKYLLVKDLGTSGNSSQQLIQPFINLSTLPVFSTIGAAYDAAAFVQLSYGNWQLGIGYNFAGKSSETLEILEPLQPGRYAISGQQYNETGGIARLYVDPGAKINAAMPSPQNSTINGSYATNISGNSALNITGSQAQGGCSSKFFMQTVHRWMQTDYCPVIAAQLAIEFSNSGNSALNQWSLGMRGGFSF